MEDKPKIMFAEGQAPQTVATIHGLPLTVSPGTSDILAAVHLGFSQAMTFWREMSRPEPPQTVTGQFNEEVGFEDDIPPKGLNPLAMAAWREAKGIKPPVFPKSENPEDHPAYKEMDENMRLQGLGDEGAENK